MSLTTTLNFFGHSETAIEFYCEHLDAEVLMMMRFGECPDPKIVTEAFSQKIFHATFRVGGTQLMASDVGCDDSNSHDSKNVVSFSGFALALEVDSAETAERYFAALAKSGNIQMVMAETFFAQRYGIVIDRFGVTWKIIVADKNVS